MTEDSNTQVKLLCAKLKSPYKEVATAHFCEELSVTEIAKRQNKNAKTIQTQLYRAKSMLKKMLAAPSQEALPSGIPQEIKLKARSLERSD